MAAPPSPVAGDEDDVSSLPLSSLPLVPRPLLSPHFLPEPSPELDWEAAAGESDTASSHTSTSSSAPPPRPPLPPAAGRWSVAKLDRFVDSFTGRKQAKEEEEAAAAADGDSPGVRAGKRRSGGANGADGMAAVLIDAKAAEKWINPAAARSGQATLERFENYFFIKRKRTKAAAAAPSAGGCIRERSLGDANEMDDVAAAVAAVSINAEAAAET